MKAMAWGRFTRNRISTRGWKRVAGAVRAVARGVRLVLARPAAHAVTRVVASVVTHGAASPCVFARTFSPPTATCAMRSSG